MSVQLVGSRREYDGDWTEEIVATFDNKKDAKQYLKNSWLKNSERHKKPFRQKSLLAGFQYADIEEIELHDPPPHNPKMLQSKRRK